VADVWLDGAEELLLADTNTVASSQSLSAVAVAVAPTTATERVTEAEAAAAEAAPGAADMKLTSSPHPSSSSIPKKRKRKNPLTNEGSWKLPPFSSPFSFASLPFLPPNVAPSLPSSFASRGGWTP
jgi:hypothetical protein